MTLYKFCILHVADKSGYFEPMRATNTETNNNGNDTINLMLLVLAHHSSYQSNINLILLDVCLWMSFVISKMNDETYVFQLTSQEYT